MKKRVLFFVVILFACISDLPAQDRAGDSISLQRSIAFVHSLAMQNMGAASYLYTGIAYERYWNRVSGHPFFVSDSFHLGVLEYSGNSYSNVPLLYDVNKDIVVTKDFSGNVNIRLSGEKIRSFGFDGKVFTRIDAGATTSVAPGFYEILYSNHYAVLAKHSKMILESKTESNTARFLGTDYFFVEKEGVYHPITSESDLLSLFRDQRAEMKKFLNRKEIDFKKNAAAAIVKTVQYYEQLKQ